jgi:hypothetical protein
MRSVSSIGPTNPGRWQRQLPIRLLPRPQIPVEPRPWRSTESHKVAPPPPCAGRLISSPGRKGESWVSFEGKFLWRLRPGGVMFMAALKCTRRIQGAGPRHPPGGGGREAAALPPESGRSTVCSEIRGDRRPLLRGGLRSQPPHRIGLRRLLWAMLSRRPGSITALRRECHLRRPHGAYPRRQSPAASLPLSAIRPLHTPLMFPPMHFGAA